MMSNPEDTGTASPLELEIVSRAAAELAAETELDRLLALFMGRVREWASPSAVLAAVRDPAAEGGWRLLPALCFGSGPLGAERALPQLIEETPGCLERPTLIHPAEPAPGVQARDNCILPWAHEGESGVLVIRGIPRPAPENLGDAVALLAAPVWARLLGSPAGRMESLVAELRHVAGKLEADAERHIERLRAAHPTRGPEGTPEEPTSREKLEAALGDAARVAAERDGLRERLLAVETALKETEAERDRTRAELERERSVREDAARAVAERDEARAAMVHAETGRREAEEKARLATEEAGVLEESLKTARAELQAARREREQTTVGEDEVQGRVAALEESLRQVERERDHGREENEGLMARLESMQAERASAVQRAEEQRRAATDAARTFEETLATAKGDLESARREVERVTATDQELKARIAALEEDLRRTVADREEARSARERLETERQTAKGSVRDLEEALASAHVDLELARRDQQRAVAEAAETKARADSLEATLREHEAVRDGLRRQMEALEQEKSEAETRVRTAEDALERAGHRASEATTGDRAPAVDDSSGRGAERALDALRSTLRVLRRTPFVPPELRLSLEDGATALDEPSDAREKWLRVVLLDRDAGSLAPVADELEAAGVDVRVANYPEELALLMKTPDAQGLNALVCDILAFRPDQTVAGLFRAWEKDRPGLAFLLSFNQEDAAEAERAKRVPMSLTAGRVPRPIPTAELVEKLRVLAKKQGAGS